jgi:hypothetical protein
MRQPLARRAAPIVFALALGILNVVLLLGTGPLNPSNTSWIFGDNATYYSAWEQYRHDPHIHYPLAWTERIGYPIGTSVAFLDGLPLAAVLLRPFSPLLPIPFQYLGFWALLSLVLQAYFGYSVCRRLFPDDPVYCALGAVLFSLSFPLIARAEGHTTLLSQWLILAAFDGYLRDPGEHPVRWMWQLWIVAALATAITPYLAVMCALLAVAGVGRVWIEKRVTLIATAALLVATVAVVIVTGSAFGVLASDDAGAYWAPGYGEFSWNLNAFVNPMDHGSLLLHALPLANPRQYEGYSYLGLGVIALLVINVARRPQALRWMFERRLLPLVAAGVVFAGLAASAVVTFGSHTLFTVPLPKIMLHAVGTVRASGRFAWPPYYLLDLGVLALTFWLWKPPLRYGLLIGALALQIADVMPIRHEVRGIADHRFGNSTPSEIWKGLGSRYQDLILVPAFQCDPVASPGGMYSYVYFGKLAALEQLRLNSYYAARYTHPQMQGHCLDLMRGNLNGPLDPKSAYVVTDAVRTLWQLRGITSHVCHAADGFNLCTPSADPRSSTPDTWTMPRPPAYALGDAIDFTQPEGGARLYETIGWSGATPSGTWTEGPLSMLRLGLDPSIDRGQPLQLHVDATPFLAGSHLTLDVDVFVNGVQVTTWNYRAEKPSTGSDAAIATEIVRKRTGLDIEFRFRNPEAPLYAGAGAAPLYLGLAVRSIVVRPATAQ